MKRLRQLRACVPGHGLTPSAAALGRRAEQPRDDRGGLRRRLPPRIGRVPADLQPIRGAAIRRAGLVIVATALAACGGVPPPVSGQAPASPSAAASNGLLDHESLRLAELTFEGDLHDVPEPLAPGRPGELMRLQVRSSEGHRQYLMLYHSRSVSGDDLAVTGRLWIPETPPPADGYPIVSFGPGTHGHFSDACPYSNLEAWNPPEYDALIDRLLHEGYVVAYTDWHGLGTRFPYTYAVGEAEAYALLDAARAARDLLGPDASDDVFLVGHSVGGYGVMAATKFGPDYDEGLDVRGAVIIDGANDHRTEVEIGMSGDVDVSLLMFGILGYSRAYPELSLSDVLAPEAIADMGWWDTTPCNVDPPWDGTIPRDAIPISPLELEPWVKRIEEGIANTPSYPVLYPLAAADPESDTRVTAGKRIGAQITFYPEQDHYSIIIAAADEYIAWMNERR